MRVHVRLFATLRHNRFKTSDLDVPVGATVLQVAEMLKIPREELALILINGKNAEPEQTLQENDTLSLFPPVGGG